MVRKVYQVGYFANLGIFSVVFVLASSEQSWVCTTQIMDRILLLEQYLVQVVL